MPLISLHFSSYFPQQNKYINLKMNFLVSACSNSHHTWSWSAGVLQSLYTPELADQGLAMYTRNFLAGGVEASWN